MKTKLILLFGGNSVEHEISVISAMQAYHSYQNDDYEFIPVYLSKKGIFYTGKQLTQLEKYRDIDKLLSKCQKVRFYHKKEKSFIVCCGIKTYFEAVFLIVHGNNCEDGSLYSFFSTQNIKCIGLDNYSGSISQDKVYFRDILKANNFFQVPYFSIKEFEYFESSDKVLKQIKTISYPVILKPARLGSSIGIKICHDDCQFIDSIEEVFKYDKKVIVEKYLEPIKEYNISLLVDRNTILFSPIEEVGNECFLSYDDKYKQNSTKGMAGLTRKVPANIDKALENKIKNLAKKCALLIDSSLCIRVDFIYDYQNKKLYINEVNNIPGSLAFYLWEKDNISFSNLLDKIIRIGLKQEDNKTKYLKTYQANIFNSEELHKFKFMK